MAATCKMSDKNLEIVHSFDYNRDNNPSIREFFDNYPDDFY